MAGCPGIICGKQFEIAQKQPRNSSKPHINTKLSWLQQVGEHKIEDGLKPGVAYLSES